MDGLSLTSYVYDQIGAVRVITNEMLTDIMPIGKAFVPVKVFGTSSNSQIKSLKKVSQDKDICLITFPAAKVARKVKGKIMDSEWSSSFIDISLKGKRPLILTHCHAKNHPIFYCVNKIRKVLKIKTNLEMLLLPYFFLSSKKKKIRFHMSAPITNEELKILLNQTKNTCPSEKKAKKNTYQSHLSICSQ